MTSTMESNFVWTSDLNVRLLELRFEFDWLFKKKKQPWSEFHKILLEHGFPKDMTIKHVSKKYSYLYDTYKNAKRTKNKSWKYYKLFDKHLGKNKILDKYDSWSDEWRLKLITCVTEAKVLKVDFHNMWRTVERAMRYQDPPVDCCMLDMKGLWQHIRTTFARKHRLKLKKGSELSEWPLYDSMLEYYKKYEPSHLRDLETERVGGLLIVDKTASKYSKKADTDKNDNESNEFHWSKDITETFIQIRLQNDWIFRERKWAWSTLRNIMIQEYGFPKTLDSREICKKWASTFSEYQKAKATNNKSWVYYTLFELYLGEGSLSLNPLVGWQEEWVFNLISARTDLDHLFQFSDRDQTGGWREVEKRLRSIGIPLDHSLLDLPELWTHLVKTFKWKKKFASKGILNEHWPYFDAMRLFIEKQETRVVKAIKKQKVEVDYDDVPDDDYEDDMKLFDLKQRLQLVKPKFEVENQCRSCSNEVGCVNIFEQKDDGGLDLAHKLRVIAGIEIEEADRLPPQICLNCLKNLEDAYNFRQRCQEVDKQYRDNTQRIKIELKDLDDNYQSENVENETKNDDRHELEEDNHFDDEPLLDSESKDAKMPVKKEPQKIKKRKKVRKTRYDYWKICEICGKNTRNLISHLDMHSKGKSYSCDVCDKKFKFKSGLIIHKAVHDPTPRKTCEVCGKTFHILAQYRRHFVYHANERKFECETCGKRFNTLDILRVHNRIHTDERPFSCQECGKTFRTAGCVSRHKRIVHRNVKSQ